MSRISRCRAQALKGESGHRRFTFASVLIRGYPARFSGPLSCGRLLPRQSASSLPTKCGERAMLLMTITFIMKYQDDKICLTRTCFVCHTIVLLYPGTLRISYNIPCVIGPLIRTSQGAVHRESTLDDVPREPPRITVGYSVPSTLAILPTRATACDMATQTKLHFCPLPSNPQPGSSSPRPPYQEPHLLHTYSHLPSREIQHNVPPLAYHARAPIGCDLNNGFKQRTERDPRLQEHLDGLCEGLIRYVRRKGSLKKGALVTWRGMLTRCVADVLLDEPSLKLSFIRLGY